VGPDSDGAAGRVVPDLYSSFVDAAIKANEDLSHTL
jgi:hypothetical protein